MKNFDWLENTKNKLEKQKPVYTDKMRNCVRDYANEFIGFKMIYNHQGIKGINEIMKDHKLITFEQYLEEKKGLEKYETITNEEYKNPIVQKKTRELDEIAVQFNTNGVTMDEATFQELMKKMFEIIDSR